MKIVAVQFPKSDYYASSRQKNYHYLTDIEDIAVGDTVVVEAPSSGMTCVKVTAIDPDEIAVKAASKWVVCRIDVTAYKERIARDKQKATLIAKLHKLKAQVLEANQFAALAEMSPEAAALVEELKALS